MHTLRDLEGTGVNFNATGLPTVYGSTYAVATSRQQNYPNTAVGALIEPLELVSVDFRDRLSRPEALKTAMSSSSLIIVHV